MNIIDSDYNIINGFFWVEFQDGKSLQVCLENDLGRYLKTINLSDCGIDTGMCLDCNDWFFERNKGLVHYDQKIAEAKSIIAKEAKKHGIICY